MGKTNYHMVLFNIFRETTCGEQNKYITVCFSVFFSCFILCSGWMGSLKKVLYIEVLGRKTVLRSILPRTIE
jgi:hypothetical protein